MRHSCTFWQRLPQRPLRYLLPCSARTPCVSSYYDPVRNVLTQSRRPFIYPSIIQLHGGAHYPKLCTGLYCCRYDELLAHLAAIVSQYSIRIRCASMM
ncbi:hypothetical protein OBBRIDRAFT_144523 [Obba rivulosa]|uniref:Uncharacterized protein n=1 Tax=Obba rivulosa TaxID=1052685 RepID=A0A8E2J4I5_9APHY|nr:hypothetical protein OBBRIDRAFT_144523 [Obba rivulosa]